MTDLLTFDLADTDDQRGLAPAPEKHHSLIRKAIDSARKYQWLKMHGRQERLFARDMKSLLMKQVQSITRRLKSATDATDPATIFNPRAWDKQVASTAKPHVRRTCLVGASDTLKKQESRRKADTAIEMPSRVLRAIQDYLDEVMQMSYWREINDTTATRLASQIQISLERGESLPQMSRRVADALGLQAGPRALSIARTETTGALGASAQAVYDEMQDEGNGEAIFWLANDDRLTRPTHAEADDQEQDEDGEFTVGGEKARFPGDPRLSAKERVGCRCGTYSKPR